MRKLLMLLGVVLLSGIARPEFAAAQVLPGDGGCFVCVYIDDTPPSTGYSPSCQGSSYGGFACYIDYVANECRTLAPGCSTLRLDAVGTLESVVPCASLVTGDPEWWERAALLALQDSVRLIEPARPTLLADIGTYFATFGS